MNLMLQERRQHEENVTVTVIVRREQEGMGFETLNRMVRAVIAGAEVRKSVGTPTHLHPVPAGSARAMRSRERQAALLSRTFALMDILTEAKGHHGLFFLSHKVIIYIEERNCN